jgi:hypothetical protein
MAHLDLQNPLADFFFEKWRAKLRPLHIHLQINNGDAITYPTMQTASLHHHVLIDEKLTARELF